MKIHLCKNVKLLVSSSGDPARLLLESQTKGNYPQKNVLYVSNRVFKIVSSQVGSRCYQNDTNHNVLIIKAGQVYYQIHSTKLWVYNKFA